MKVISRSFICLQNSTSMLFTSLALVLPIGLFGVQSRDNLQSTKMVVVNKKSFQLGSYKNNFEGFEKEVNESFLRDFPPGFPCTTDFAVNNFLRGVRGLGGLCLEIFLVSIRRFYRRYVTRIFSYFSRGGGAAGGGFSLPFFFISQLRYYFQEIVCRINKIARVNIKILLVNYISNSPHKPPPSPPRTFNSPFAG